MSAVLPYRLAAAIEATEYPFAFPLLQPQDLTAGKRLYAAALRDILGLPRKDIGQEISLSLRKTDDAITRARADWSRLGGWPWWYFDERNGEPPDGWRERGGGPFLDAALLTWATGQLYPPGHRRPVGGFRSGKPKRVQTDDLDAIHE